MSIVSSEIQEGVLLEEEFISIPRGLFEKLIRAETERDILEATIEGKNSYLADEVLSAIKDARKKHLRSVPQIEIDNCLPAESVGDEVNSDTEGLEIREEEISGILDAMVESGNLSKKQELACCFAATIARLWSSIGKSTEVSDETETGE